MLNSSIKYLTTAPDVIIPHGRFLNEVLPAAKGDTSFFKKQQYAIYDKQGRYISINKRTLALVMQHPRDYILRHASGHDAALGRLVFRFNNIYHVDLHDMPKKDFFYQDSRAITTGCIWLDDAEKLGQLILKNDGQPESLPELSKGIKKYKRNVFILKRPLPITIVYLTCVITDGKLLFYPDIYHQDAELAGRLFPTNRKTTY